MKKLVFLAFVTLLLVGCGMAMDGLDVSNGTEYVVTGKRVSKDGYGYLYNLVKVGDTWYDYAYKDTANFNVGDTIVITVRRVNN